jgi:hypothetical protein
MSPRTPEKSLSDAIFEPITKAYKAGGLGLAFLALGAFLMLAAFVRPQRDFFSALIVVTGFGLIALTCILFYFKDVLPLYRVRREIHQNKELIDAVQTAALQMTEVASDLQALAFKHASTVASAMQDLRPAIRRIPVVGGLADAPGIVQANSLSAAIVDYTTKAKTMIADVEDAIVHSDATRLKAYILQLKELRADVANVLKA